MAVYKDCNSHCFAMRIHVCSSNVESLFHWSLKQFSNDCRSRPCNDFLQHYGLLDTIGYKLCLRDTYFISLRRKRVSALWHSFKSRQGYNCGCIYSNCNNLFVYLTTSHFNWLRQRSCLVCSSIRNILDSGNAPIWLI